MGSRIESLSAFDGGPFYHDVGESGPNIFGLALEVVMG